jgi:hypothetical protein
MQRRGRQCADVVQRALVLQNFLKCVFSFYSIQEEEEEEEENNNNNNNNNNIEFP